MIRSSRHWNTERTASAQEPPRPLLRGTLHLAAAVAAPFGLVWLMLISGSPSRYVGGAVFASSLILLYATSASYHLIPWRPRFRRLMKRADHAMIFVLIAGSYTPFCLVVLNRPWGISMLAVVWSIAGAGMVTKIAWPDAPRWLSSAMYLTVGWLAAIASVQIVQSLSAAALVLLLTGGLLYTIGAFIYASRRPDPFPRVFGYHEVFHLLVIGGSAIHFALVAVYIA